jgi:hypothetical protein
VDEGDGQGGGPALAENARGDDAVSFLLPSFPVPLDERAPFICSCAVIWLFGTATASWFCKGVKVLVMIPGLNSLLPRLITPSVQIIEGNGMALHLAHSQSPDYKSLVKTFSRYPSTPQ